MRKLLVDMLDAAQAIQSYVRGESIETFGGDITQRSAVYFKFIVIGEALTQLRIFDAVLVRDISESSRIIGFRNQIVHGYGQLDDKVTWRIIERKLPALMEELRMKLVES